MTDNIPISKARVQPGSRLENLLATYAELKPKADEYETRIKSIKDAIKSELNTAHPNAQKIEVDHPALTLPLRLSYVESWSLDAKTLKAERPEVYVTYARKGGKWELRGVKP